VLTSDNLTKNLQKLQYYIEILVSSTGASCFAANLITTESWGQPFTYWYA